jgi:hypothetical protein
MTATDPTEALWFAQRLLIGRDPDARPWAIDEAERLLRNLPPCGSRDDGLAVIAPARAGDASACQQLADSLFQVRLPLERARDAAQAAEPGAKQKRRPSIKRMIAAAERDGRKVTSITTPDGVTLNFDKTNKTEDTEASNPWLADLEKVTKQ